MHTQQYTCPTLKAIPSYLCKPVTSLLPSFLSSEHHFFYFAKKIKAIKRQFSQAPTYPPGAPPSLHIPNKRSPPPWTQPIFSHLLKCFTLAITPIPFLHHQLSLSARFLKSAFKRAVISPFGDVTTESNGWPLIRPWI